MKSSSRTDMSNIGPNNSAKANAQPDKQLMIEGASCASCVNKIEGALQRLPGVVRAEMNLADRSVTVAGSASDNQLIKALQQLGYGAKARNPETSDDAILDEKDQLDQLHYRRLIRDAMFALGLGVPLMFYGLFIGDMSVSNSSQQIAWLLVGLVTLGVMLLSGRHFYIGGWKSITSHTANMDTLVALGTGTAWLYSMLVVLAPELLPSMARHVYFEATAMIIGLINLGLAMEVKARGKTSQAIRRLIGLQAKTARVNRAGEELDIAIEDVVVDDLIRIRPGEKIPVDGIVVEGHTAIDESMLTGEPMPIEKKANDKLATGTLNKTGSVIYRATHIGKDTALAQIISMVKHAQNSKPPISQLADLVAAYFVPSVMIIAVISSLLWLNFGPQPSVAFAVVCATTVLIIACPCALGLATPMSVMVGVGKAAEAGMLIRNGEALQSASKITTIVLDKTGTITLGQPKVTNILPAANATESEILYLAASLESVSEHPLAQAIVESAQEQGIVPSNPQEFTAIVGRGVSGLVEGKQVYFGNERLMYQQAIDIAQYREQAQQLASDAKTPMYIAVDGMLAAVIAVADPIKDDSISAIKRLQSRGMRIVMLTGDNQQTAAAVAKKVGITEYFAQVLPEDKTEHIRKLQRQGEVVGMTGDGINDAPALATANVGFAIGTGTDVAIESADVTLMRGSLHGLADAIAVSNATLRNVKQNLFGAFIYNVAGVPIAAGALYPFYGFLLSPIIAGGAMALSSLTVVINANRLRLFKPEQY